jgi:hypothetical protein
LPAIIIIIIMIIIIISIQEETHPLYSAFMFVLSVSWQNRQFFSVGKTARVARVHTGSR